jgi:hypothetical protein
MPCPPGSRLGVNQGTGDAWPRLSRQPRGQGLFGKRTRYTPLGDLGASALTYWTSSPVHGLPASTMLSGAWNPPSEARKLSNETHERIHGPIHEISMTDSRRRSRTRHLACYAALLLSPPLAKHEPG